MFGRNAARSTPAAFSATVYCTRAKARSRLFCSASATASRMVSLRSSCARAGIAAQRERSTSEIKTIGALENIFLFISQRFRGLQPRSAIRGQISEQHARGAGYQERQNYRDPGNRDVNA